MSTEVEILKGHTDFAQCAGFSSDSTHIVSSSYDESVQVWNLKDDGLHWMFTPQNWIVSLPHQDHLMWVPSEIRDVLHHPHNVLIISRKGSATVDFIHSKMGTAWAECYTPLLV